MLRKAAGQILECYSTVGHQQLQGWQQEPELLVGRQAVGEQAPSYQCSQLKPVSERVGNVSVAKDHRLECTEVQLMPYDAMSRNDICGWMLLLMLQQQLFIRHAIIPA